MRWVVKAEENGQLFMNERKQNIRRVSYNCNANCHEKLNAHIERE